MVSPAFSADPVFIVDDSERILNSETTSLPLGLGARLKPYWATIAVFVFSASIACGVFFQEWSVSEQHAEQSLSDSMWHAGDDVIKELREYEDALLTIRGFLDASTAVDKSEWSHFLSSSRLSDRFPGAVGFAYVQRVPQDGLDGFLVEARAETPGFEIHFPKNSDNMDHGTDMFVIRYHHPEWRNRIAIGLDIASKFVNKDVYERAAMSGKVAASEPLHLYQMNNEQWGIVLAIPVYAKSATRKDGPLDEPCIGWIATPVGFDDFFAGIEDSDWAGYDFQLYAGNERTPGAELFGDASLKSDPDNDANRAEIPFTIGGKSFMLVVHPEKHMGSADLARAQLVGIVAYFLVFVLTGIVFMSSRTSVKARALAMRMTQSLHEKDVQQQVLINRANAANVSKSGFLANMSHEIRTPLTAVLGYTEMLSDQLSDKADKDELYRSLNCIQRSGKHLRSIINDILDLSKIDAGKIDLCLTRSCLPDLVCEAADTFRIRAHKKNLSLSLNVESAIPEYIQTDEIRIRQVLINLIGNAVKFTDKGEVSVGVRYSNGTLAFTILDSGIGIEPEVMKGLFHPFERADNSFTRRHEGTGLGLTISRRIARLMRGDVIAESTPGVGSSFTFWLPIEVEPDTKYVESIPGFQPIAPGEHNDAEQRANGRVLLVEDGVDNQRLVSHFLRRVGMKVEFASNGKVALEVLEKDDAFDVILMDMQMPVMDGYTAARVLRELGCKIPIIALTAHAMRGDREKCINAGCTDYLTKPIDRNHMISVVNEYVGPKTRRSDAA